MSEAHTVSVDGGSYRIADVPAFAGSELHRLPWVLRVLLENVLRRGSTDSAAAILSWLAQGTSQAEIAFHPGRLLMHDTTCVPALVDIAALRSAVAEAGQDPARLNPVLPVDVSVDHSIAVDYYATPDALQRNMQREIERNAERYRLLKWATRALRGVNVHAPGTGIMHTINLERLATVVTTESRDGVNWALPDSLIGTDSHTPMINGLGVLAWGVGGLEAESVMFGMPVMLRVPDVVGVRLTGSLPEGTLATDLVLLVTERLRRMRLAGKFVEFFGPGVSTLSCGERAVVANMAPEYGASTGFFPIDQRTLDYLLATGRSHEHVSFVEMYARRQGLWFDPACTPRYTETLEIDLGSVQVSLAGPRRPQDRLSPHSTRSALAQLVAGQEGLPAQDSQLPRDTPAAPVAFAQRPALVDEVAIPQRPAPLSEVAAPERPALLGEVATPERQVPADEVPFARQQVPSGAVAIAAITSCTNTSDARLAIAAGLLAKKARALGLRPPPWVKTSFAPGSPTAERYLRRAGLLEDMEALGFGIVGYGCTTCIGNSGPLSDTMLDAVSHGTLPVAVLSGNRNFPGRVHPQIDANFLASPPLVIAYALAGDIDRDILVDPIGITSRANKALTGVSDAAATRPASGQNNDQTGTASGRNDEQLGRVLGLGDDRIKTTSGYDNDQIGTVSIGADDQNKAVSAQDNDRIKTATSGGEDQMRAAAIASRESAGGIAPGQPVYLRDIWPSGDEIDASYVAAMDPGDVSESYERAERNEMWLALDAPATALFPWEEKSTYIRRPPFATVAEDSALGSYSAQPLLVLGDDVTTDHISPAGQIPATSDAAKHLIARGENPNDLNVFASRRGNWEVMLRGLYTNRSVRNLLDPTLPPGTTRHGSSETPLSLWQAADRYRQEGTSVVVVAGERYGTGSSRDWAAKGLWLLGVRAVLAMSFERIHRSNLIGMGILPLHLPAEHSPAALALTIGDTLEIDAAPEQLAPGGAVPVSIRRSDGTSVSFTAHAAVETVLEIELLKAGGILPHILNRTLHAAK